MPGITVNEIKATVEMPKLIAYILEIDGLDPIDDRNMCRCLVHDDNHPSMMVNEETCFCFACDKTWDIIGIVRDHYQFTHTETLVWFEDHIDELSEYAETKATAPAAPKVITSARSIKILLLIGIHFLLPNTENTLVMLVCLMIILWIVTESDGGQTSKPSQSLSGEDNRGTHS